MTEAGQLVDQELLELECQLRFTALCVANLGKPPPRDIELYEEGFLAGVEAAQQPRDRAVLESAISVARARAAGLIK